MKRLRKQWQETPLCCASYLNNSDQRNAKDMLKFMVFLVLLFYYITMNLDHIM